MDKKELAKKYLLYAFLLFFIGTVFLFAFISGISRLKTGAGLIPFRALMYAALLSVIPLGSFTGFVTAGTKIRELKTSKAALIVALFPLVLAAVTVYGVIMIVPEIVISLKSIIRG